MHVFVDVKNHQGLGQSLLVADCINQFCNQTFLTAAVKGTMTSVAFFVILVVFCL
jgi:inner membrane protein involved in colicin E2 resistance